MKKKFEKSDILKRGNDRCCHSWHHHHSSSAVYGLGFIGSAIYYITTATSFWMGVLGVLKAIVWPAFLVYGLLKSLGM